jgi:hypothetical protein
MVWDSPNRARASRLNPTPSISCGTHLRQHRCRSSLVNNTELSDSALRFLSGQGFFAIGDREVMPPAPGSHNSLNPPDPQSLRFLPEEPTVNPSLRRDEYGSALK